MLVRALLGLYQYFGDDFKIECPTGSGNQMTLFEVAKEISGRLANIFTRGKDGRRPVFGSVEKFQTDPHWRDYIPFHEYFHGDNGSGIGASHQTGWTGCVAKLMQLFASVEPADMLRNLARAGVHCQPPRGAEPAKAPGREGGSVSPDGGSADGQEFAMIRLRQAAFTSCAGLFICLMGDAGVGAGREMMGT